MNAKPMDERGEGLIRDALEITSNMASMRARLNLIENELDRYFPRQAAEEHAMTEFGLAHRMQHEEIHIDPHHVEAVRRALGSEFDRYFSLTPYCAPTEECRELLSNGSSYLGHLLRDALIIKRHRRYSYSPRWSPQPMKQERPC